MSDLKKRLRNYGLWVSVASLVPLALRTFGMDVIDFGEYNSLVDGVLTVLVLAGIINNPTTNNAGFSDDKGA